jgi:hypothetical protein
MILHETIMAYVLVQNLKRPEMQLYMPLHLHRHLRKRLLGRCLPLENG